MVLSNKKLKQKLRAHLTQPTPTTDAEPKPESQSLKLLLDSASQRPRLSKREKRRESLPERAPEEKKVTGSEKKTKRKREEGDGASGSEENGVVSKREKTGEEVAKKKSTKKKKKKSSNRKKQRTQKDEEANQKKMGVNEEENQAAIENQDCSPVEENFETKVYAGGIPYYSTEDDIRSYFESCGTITEIDCMKFPETGKFRGIAIINFKTDAAAKRALALDGSDMGGLYLTIQQYKANRATKSSDFAPKIVEGYYRIYAGNLSWDITEDKLRNFFTDCKISSVRFGNDKNTGEFRGYAHIDFVNSVSFTMALKLDQKVICGRPIRIRCAVPLKKEASDTAMTGPTTVPTPTETAPPISTPTRYEPVDTDLPLSSTGTGKMKRRTCYECGDKGHISSDCPKKKTAVSVPETVSRTEASYPSSVLLKTSISETSDQNFMHAKGVFSNQNSAHASTEYFNRDHVPVTVETAEVNTGLSGVSAGKLRRRTCYECGEKGHISSDCPKMQTA